jgi:hypothetical protein
MMIIPGCGADLAKEGRTPCGEGSYTLAGVALFDGGFQALDLEGGRTVKDQESL